MPYVRLSQTTRPPGSVHKGVVVFQSSRMQPGEGYQYDSGPLNGAHGSQIPVGSRLSQYLANNSRQEMFTGPSFGPGTPINVNAPVFVPKHQQQQQQQLLSPQPLVSQFGQMAIHDVPHQLIPFNQVNAAQQPYGPIPHMNQRPPLHQAPLPVGSQHQQAYDRYQQENRGGTTYFYQEAAEMHQPEEPYHDPEMQDGCIIVNTPGMFGYSAPLPLSHMTRFRGKANANHQTQFISPDVRSDLLQRQLSFDMRIDPHDYPSIPPAVEHYSNLVPLESITLQNQSQSTFKAFSCRDGNYYCLRRIHGTRIQHPGKHTHLVEQWKKLVHGNIVALREILINCRAFDDSSLIFVYDYYPLSHTLMSKHFDCKGGNFYDPTNAFRMNAAMSTPMPISGTGAPETVLWSYTIQIAGALRAIHSSGLACRSLELNKIIVYGNKLMLSFCGIQDVLDPEPMSIQQLQNEDLNMFGQVLVALATGRPNAWRADLLPGAKKQIEDSYSPDFKNVVNFFLNTQSGIRRSINDIMPMIGGRFFTVMENMQAKSDTLEAELSRELENGRLFRLLAKLNTVLERTELMPDEKYNETGDRFMLKLFRDYVFHQMTDQGKPWLDMAHIVQCLNKLDIGSREKVEMVSRNGDTQIIVAYQDLKQCLEKAFSELIGVHLLPR